MALYNIDNLSFSYPNELEKVLENINFSVNKGQFVLICGSSGSGKTTLLKHLKKDITPIGTQSGNIFYKNKDISIMNDLESVQEIGMVFQNPEEQIVMDTPINEICFSMENIGLAPEEIKSRLAEIVTYFGLDNILHKNIDELSGGQKQIVNLCSVLALQPDVLILDEPTSQLDPLSTKELINMIKELNSQLNITIIMSAHLLDPVMHMADKIIYLKDRSISLNLTKENFNQIAKNNLDEFTRYYLPSVAKLKLTVATDDSTLPLTIREGRSFAEEHKEYFKCLFKNIDKTKMPYNPNQEKPFLNVQNCFFSYGIDEPLVLKNISLKVYKDEFISILGANGSGKSTLLKILSGLLFPKKGKIKIDGLKTNKIPRHLLSSQIGYVAQNPILHFSQDSVKEELDLVNNKNSWKENSWLVHLIDLFDLKGITKHHPYDLSGGQQQKLAIVLSLANQPDILCLDEPTKGLDPISKNSLASILSELKKFKTTIIAVTHDIDFAANFSTRTLFLFDEEIIYDANPRLFFTKNRYYTTNINQVLKDINPNIMTIEEVLKCMNK